MKFGMSGEDIIHTSEILADKPDWTKYYFLHDGHWNAAGHKLIADYLEEHLKKGALTNSQ